MLQRNPGPVPGFLFPNTTQAPCRSEPARDSGIPFNDYGG
ncbi:hypothetical protein ACIOUG_25515 [Pseudomonas sp. NPDC087803]